MKKTSLHAMHEKLRAKLVEFAGFHMPIQFTGLTEEHLAVRNAAGMFDVSHMGEIWINGPNALDLIQYITTNDASRLNPGEAQYSCMPNGKGGIVDDILVYRYSDEKYFLVVNASNVEKDFRWIKTNNRFGAEVQNASDEISQIALQGPNAIKILQGLTDIDLQNIGSFKFKVGEVAECDQVIVSNTGYTGAGGFELYFYNESAEKIWKAIIVEGRDYGLKCAGLGARDTLRLEMGYCLYGNDIDDNTSPIEAGLGWITKFLDEKDFIDKDLLQRQKKEGVKRRLRGFILSERGIPRKDYRILNERGDIIGKVTSGTFSPSMKEPIGMGYIDTQFSALENEIYIEIRQKPVKARIVKMPFYQAK